MSEKVRIYLPGLIGIRDIAAMAVVFFQIPIASKTVKPY